MGAQSGEWDAGRGVGWRARGTPSDAGGDGESDGGGASLGARRVADVDVQHVDWRRVERGCRRRQRRCQSLRSATRAREGARPRRRQSRTAGLGPLGGRLVDEPAARVACDDRRKRTRAHARACRPRMMRARHERAMIAHVMRGVT